MYLSSLVRTISRPRSQSTISLHRDELDAINALLTVAYLSHTFSLDRLELPVHLTTTQSSTSPVYPAHLLPLLQQKWSSHKSQITSKNDTDHINAVGGCGVRTARKKPKMGGKWK